jgi:hypothetical protein
MHRAMIRSAVVCAAVIFVVIGANQPAAAGSRWHPREGHSHARERHSHARERRSHARERRSHQRQRHSVPQGTQRYELAVFEWQQLSRLDDEVAGRLRWLRSEGFTTVYADFGEYIEAADEGLTLDQLGSDLQHFVAYASSLGFEVHAVGGGPNWIDEDLRYLATMLVELVGDYNTDATSEERLRGVQFDIEPQADPAFQVPANRPAMLRAWLTTLQSVIATYRGVQEQDGNSGLRLGIAIPFWFDDEPEAAPWVVFPESDEDTPAKPAAFHLFDMLVDLPNAYVVVLSYRNFTGGLDGSIAHAQDEFIYARDHDAQFGIVVGQEFTNVRPEKVTFWCRGRAVFRQAAAEITDFFGDDYPQFRGLSVNDMDAYLATPEYVVLSRSRIMGGWRTQPRCQGVGGAPALDWGR